MSENIVNMPDVSKLDFMALRELKAKIEERIAEIRAS